MVACFNRHPRGVRQFPFQKTRAVTGGDESKSFRFTIEVRDAPAALDQIRPKRRSSALQCNNGRIGSGIEGDVEPVLFVTLTDDSRGVAEIDLPI